MLEHRTELKLEHHRCDRAQFSLLEDACGTKNYHELVPIFSRRAEYDEMPKACASSHAKCAVLHSEDAPNSRLADKLVPLIKIQFKKNDKGVKSPDPHLPYFFSDTIEIRTKGDLGKQIKTAFESNTSRQDLVLVLGDVPIPNLKSCPEFNLMRRSAMFLFGSRSGRRGSSESVE